MHTLGDTLAEWLALDEKALRLLAENDEAAAIEARRAEEMRANLPPQWLRGVPASYRWATMTAPELAERVKNQQPLAEHIGLPRLLLQGPAGAGKTSAAVAMGMARCDGTRQHGLFVEAYRLGTARIQHKAGDGEAPLVERAMTTPFLILDDIGSERDTQNNAIPDVLFYRHAEALNTWITTGMTSQDLASRYGAGILRRITEGVPILRFGVRK